VAVFGTQGTASNITINLKKATDQTQQVGRIDLRDGTDRTISNGNNASGQLRINGVEGQLLVNTSTSGTLTFAESRRRDMDLHLATAGALEVTHTGARIVIQSSLTGTHGFDKTGHGTLELTTSNTITGTVTLTGGTVVLASSTGGALQHVSSVTVGAGATLQLCASHQLGHHIGGAQAIVGQGNHAVEPQVCHLAHQRLGGGAVVGVFGGQHHFSGLFTDFFQEGVRAFVQQARHVAFVGVATVGRLAALNDLGQTIERVGRRKRRNGVGHL
jgi:autotransporter-associated beta strand protein